MLATIGGILTDDEKSRTFVTSPAKKEEPKDTARHEIRHLLQHEDRFERSVSTVSKKFHEVLDCVDRITGDYIRPHDDTFTEVHDKIKEPRFWPYFKDAIGAIDGTHVPVIVAEKDKIKYTNRKGYTSQNVLAICDFDLRFTFAVPGWPGSAHDTRVWTDARPRF